MGIQEFFEMIGKAIPNEIAKTNSITKNIPYLNAITQPLSAVDAGATAYGDTGNVGTGLQAGVSGYNSSQDPGQYGGGGVATGGKPNRDIWNMVGQSGNAIQNPKSALNNPYFGTDKLNNKLSDLLKPEEKAAMATSPIGKEIAKDPEVSRDILREIMAASMDLYLKQPKQNRMDLNEINKIMIENLISGGKK